MITSRNPPTRRAYGRSIAEFLAWCEEHGLASIIDMEPLHVGAYIEAVTRSHSAPTDLLCQTDAGI
jgi:hypothetical protein